MGQKKKWSDLSATQRKAILSARWPTSPSDDVRPADAMSHPSLTHHHPEGSRACRGSDVMSVARDWYRPHGVSRVESQVQDVTRPDVHAERQLDL